ncbi:MAG TPA: NifU family protein, partial [Aggregatilineales bacterium]|nr:NifU family protein [Aggregatilineales bacterium]
MITFTDAARDKILETLRAKGQDGFAVRIRITGRDTDEFIYEFRSVEMATRREDDLVLDMGGFNLLVDPESAEHLQGSVIDLSRTGFKIDNPNPVWTDDLARRVAEVISTQINPAVAAHSGRITLVDVRDNKAYIRMQGGCQGCGLAGVTLTQGVERQIRGQV